VGVLSLFEERENVSKVSKVPDVSKEECKMNSLEVQ
jgi:hypothetical protein